MRFNRNRFYTLFQESSKPYQPCAHPSRSYAGLLAVAALRESLSGGFNAKRLARLERNWAFK